MMLLVPALKRLQPMQHEPMQTILDQCPGHHAQHDQQCKRGPTPCRRVDQYRRKAAQNSHRVRDKIRCVCDRTMFQRKEFHEHPRCDPAPRVGIALRLSTIVEKNVT